MIQTATAAQELERADPFGRPDVALYRAAELAMRRLWPKAWPPLRPFVADAVARRAPKSLGDLWETLSNWAFWTDTQQWARDRYQAHLAEWYGMPAPPSAAAPGAPQTVEQATVPGAWTPELAAQAATAKTRADIEAFFARLGTTLETRQGNSNPWPWVAAGVGALAAIALIGGRK